MALLDAGYHVVVEAPMSCTLDGADQLINEGSLLALVFTGGADADRLLNTTAGSILGTIDFRGDEGAD